MDLDDDANQECAGLVVHRDEERLLLIDDDERVAASVAFTPPDRYPRSGANTHPWSTDNLRVLGQLTDGSDFLRVYELNLPDRSPTIAVRYVAGGEFHYIAYTNLRRSYDSQIARHASPNYFNGMELIDCDADCARVTWDIRGQTNDGFTISMRIESLDPERIHVYCEFSPGDLRFERRMPGLQVDAQSRWLRYRPTATRERLQFRFRPSGSDRPIIGFHIKGRNGRIVSPPAPTMYRFVPLSTGERAYALDLQSMLE